MTPALRLKEIEDYCMRAETVSCIKALWLIARVKQLEKAIQIMLNSHNYLADLGTRMDVKDQIGQEALTTMPEGQS